MRIRSLLLIVVLSFPLCGTRAQEVPRIPLRVKSAAPIKGADASLNVLMVPLKCDAEGDIYLRGYQVGDYLAAPVTKLSADGTKRVEFNLRKVQGFDKAEIYDFAVGLHGDVYLLASTSLKERKIARFSDSGEFESSVTVDAPFLPQKFDVFPSGQFLVAGEELSEKTWAPTGGPFDALVDASGRVTARVHLTGDVVAASAGSPQKNSEPKSALSEQQQKDMVAIELGSVSIAEDGNVYLMRATNPPVVYVLDPSGNQVRKLEIQPPDKGFVVVTSKVAYDKIVVQFERKLESAPGGEQLLSLVDEQTGRREIDYISTSEIGGMFACYTPNFLSFLGQYQGQLAIQKTGP